MAQRQCSICNGQSFVSQAVLWAKLIDQWQLSPAETGYINRQQGECCANCGSNLRSIVLADALRSAFRTLHPLALFCCSPEAEKFHVLEINEAGSLHGVLQRMPQHTFAAYPEVDMHALPYPDGSFDIVVHSDTLEHVPNPVHALAECRRVLRPGGMLCFTVPVVVGRLSRSRDGLPKSYHGNAADSRDDYAVSTEYGADVWTQVVQAGFRDLHLFTLEFPAALAIGATKTPD
jgi:SAM-dependent methyltransferase